MLRLLFPLTLLVSSCGEESAPAYAEPPEYQTLHHPKFKGAFFQMEHDGEQYLVCSIHQAHLKPGAKVFRPGRKEPVIIGQRIHKQQDLHLWTFEGPPVKSADLLKYQADPEIRIDDRIFFLNQGKKIAATVVALPQGEQFRHSYKTDKPFAANGLSGSPVFLPRTGSVIGVLQTANDKNKATFGGFELLKLD